MGLFDGCPELDVRIAAFMQPAAKVAQFFRSFLHHPLLHAFPSLIPYPHRVFLVGPVNPDVPACQLIPSVRFITPGPQDGRTAYSPYIGLGGANFQLTLPILCLTGTVCPGSSLASGSAGPLVNRLNKERPALRTSYKALVAIMDWHSRYVLAWRLSNTLESDFCVEALEAALKKGVPEIFNTDQGAQFTSQAFTGLLEQHGVRVSMDGKGRYTDNLFIERLWRSLKYEEGYLKAYMDGREARGGIGTYLEFYNTVRPHQTLGYRTPAEVSLASQEASTSAYPVERPGSDHLTSRDQEVVGPALNKASNLSD